jgi:tetratricopeptide (TPR) repeat protein
MSSLALATTPGSAQIAKEWNCAGTSDVASDVQIGGCTAAIQSGKFRGKDLARAFHTRGEAYQAGGDDERAVADFNEAIRLDPNFAPAYARRGVAFGRKGELDRAIADFTEAVRLDPKLHQSYSNRGLAYARKGEYDRAIADLTEAIRLDPKSATAYHNRGVSYSRKGDLDRAIADFTEAIRINPSLAKAYFNRGLAKRKKADTPGSEADIARARELDPNVASAQSNPATPLSDQLEQRVEQRLQQLRDAPKPRNSPAPSMLTESEMQALIRRLADCWDVPKAVLNGPDLIVTIQVKLAKDGSLAEPPKVLNSNPDPRFAAATKSAIAGVTRCAPFSFLPAAKYAAWQDMILDFNPRELFGDKPR